MSAILKIIVLISLVVMPRAGLDEGIKILENIKQDAEANNEYGSIFYRFTDILSGRSEVQLKKASEFTEAGKDAKIKRAYEIMEGLCIKLGSFVSVS